MDKRLIRAYDNMTMPDRCTHRIQEKLEQQLADPQKGRSRDHRSHRPRKASWTTAAVLASLVLVVSLGTAALFLGTQGQFSLRPSNLPDFSQPAPVTRPGEEHRPTISRGEEEPLPTAEEPKPDSPYVDFPYGEQGRAFLDAMCWAMPDWQGYASLDDIFWQEFLYHSFAYPQIKPFGMAETVYGDMFCRVGTVLVSRRDAQEYVRLAMGYDLPDFRITDEEKAGIHYVNGEYQIQTSQRENVGYTYRSSEKQGSSFVTYRVIYDIYLEDPETVVGQVTFLLTPAQNSNGFVIYEKATDIKRREVSLPEAEGAARTFAQAWFANDLDTMRANMTSRDDWEYALGMSLQSSRTSAENQEYTIWEVKVYEGEPQTLGGDHLAYVNYTYRDGISRWSLKLRMTQTQDGWKVRHMDSGTPEDYDPDRKEIYAAAQNYFNGYCAGDRNWMKANMPQDSRITPKVYEGDPQTLILKRIEIQESQEDGETWYKVLIEFMESETALNPRYLFLDMEQTKDGWKIQRANEG